MGPSNPTQGPSGSPNGLMHLPSTLTGTSDQARHPKGSPNGPWLLPSARAWGLATSLGIPVSRQMVPGTSQVHGAQRPRAGSQRLAKCSLVPPQRCTASSDPARGPSGSPNGPWLLPSTRTGPSNHARGPSSSQMVPGTFPACTRAPQTPHCVRAVRQMFPGSSSVRVRGPATMRGVPAVRKMVPGSYLMRTGPSDFAREPSPNGP